MSARTRTRRNIPTLVGARPERSVFSSTDPAHVARSLKLSAKRSSRRKSDPYRSAMSMLAF
jgi:hypothetical protein